MEDITVSELRTRISENDSPMLIDVREMYEHDEFNIGGKNYPIGDIQSWMQEITDHKDDEMVLYCRTGQRSGMAVAFLKAAGFTKPRNLLGGVVEWQESE